MKSINFTISVVVVLFFVSCNRTTTKEVQVNKENQSKIDTVELPVTQLKNNDDFELFKSKFKPMDIEDFSSLGSYLNNYLIADQLEIEQVASKYKKEFLKGIDTTFIHYGYITELPNRCYLLSFLNHIIPKKECNDTTSVTMVYYNRLGNMLGNFRVFGSNMSSTPPTYNMNSKFESKDDRLTICNYEYSTGGNFGDVLKSYNLTDSIFKADLTITSFYIDYYVNEIKFINKKKQKTKVILSNELFFKPL